MQAGEPGARTVHAAPDGHAEGCILHVPMAAHGPVLFFPHSVLFPQDRRGATQQSKPSGARSIRSSLPAGCLADGFRAGLRVYGFRLYAK